MENLEYKLSYKAPEIQWAFVYEVFITKFIPPTTDIDYKVLSIWTTKAVEQLREELNNEQ